MSGLYLNLSERPLCTGFGNITDTDSLVLLIDRAPERHGRRRHNVVMKTYLERLAVLFALGRGCELSLVINGPRLRNQYRRR